MFIKAQKLSGRTRMAGKSSMNPPPRLNPNPKVDKLPQPENYRVRQAYKEDKNPALGDQSQFA